MMSPAGGRHGAIAIELSWRLARHVKAQQLGQVFAAETGFLIARDPDTVRAPDIAFVASPRDQQITDAFFPGPPDLAAEIVSPSDRYTEVEQKVRMWLDAGCRLVWVIDSALRSITVYRPGPQTRILSEQDTLDGEDVVPGFKCVVAELFL